MAAKVNKWIQKAKPKPGALHKQLGYPVGQPIPPQVLQKGYTAKVGTQLHGKTVTPLMKRRIQYAVNAQVRRKK
jgi:hypothetical protein